MTLKLTNRKLLPFVSKRTYFQSTLHLNNKKISRERADAREFHTLEIIYWKSIDKNFPFFPIFRNVYMLVINYHRNAVWFYWYWHHKHKVFRTNDKHAGNWMKKEKKKKTTTNETYTQHSRSTKHRPWSMNIFPQQISNFIFAKRDREERKKTFFVFISFGETINKMQYVVLLPWS